MVKIGWLKDNPGFIGGSELSCDALLASAPDWCEIVTCRPTRRPPPGLDAYIVQNCVQYDSRWIEPLSIKPVIKHTRDPWAVGDAVLRRWLLDNANLLIFNSPVQVEKFGYEFDNEYALVPPPVDLERFREAALPSTERAGNIFVGRIGATKGAHWAIDWALQTGEDLLMVGERWQQLRFGRLPPNIKFAGWVPNDRIPYLMGRAKRLLMFPMWVESFGRVVVEAWAAGCELMLRGDIGATWWINNHPDDLGRGEEIFWDTIAEVVR